MPNKDHYSRNSQSTQDSVDLFAVNCGNKPDETAVWLERNENVTTGNNPFPTKEPTWEEGVREGSRDSFIYIEKMIPDSGRWSWIIVGTPG